VSVNQTFVIDTTFIFRRTAEAFHGAPLLVVDGKDVTFVYGFIRDLLRLRSALGVRRGVPSSVSKVTKRQLTPM
jgi:hypothetical protein